VADLADIRAGLAANLAAVALVEDCQISPYMLDNPSPPTLMVVGPDVVDFDLAMHRGLDHWTIVVQGFAGSPVDKGRQLRLDKWLEGPASVKDAIESDVTLGGIVPGVRVVRIEAYRDYVIDQGKRVLFGAAWFVDVFNTV
jgi:hypothetical protein